ncbi:hypothetical protein Bca52824_038159 [Brassica carinata]|uniref:Aspergillus nuclease S1 n=1 Tax=Brassica carinata TaxID=52824 RepID=A0A8X7RRD8_BRACI|nr:hypothetical protein Bca52824_038159 [Brassica carinata]
MQKKLEGGGGKPTIVAVVVEPWRQGQAWRPEEATWLSIFVLDSVIHGFIPAGRANHYMSSLKAGSIVKIDRFESYFEEKTLVAVKKILPAYANGELAAVCSWPDEIKRRPEWSWTYALHFVNTPDNECNYEYSRDCHNDKCVTGAIFNYTSQLMFQFHYNLTEALMFVSHFMGDIHQPLHEGFVGDQGGNKIKLNWYEQETNLHRVWDNKIIESAQEKYYNSSLSVMIHSLQHKLKYAWSNDVPSWESCPPHESACPNPYASESIDLACKYAYKDAAPGTTLGDDYFLSRLPIVEKRIAQGGIRLAATLNRIFSPKPSLAAA